MKVLGSLAAMGVAAVFAMACAVSLGGAPVLSEEAPPRQAPLSEPSPTPPQRTVTVPCGEGSTPLEAAAEVARCREDPSCHVVECDEQGSPMPSQSP